MKKIILILSAALLSMGVAFAQDLSEATATYNAGAEALQSGDKASALSYFQKALTLGQACGEEGAELVGNCKNAIPTVMLGIAKDSFNAKDFATAITKLDEAAKVAKEYGNEDVATEAEGLIPTARMQKANAAFSAKDFATAIEDYKTILAADATNGNAALRLGSALAGTGKVDEAVEAFETAAANGQEAAAKKQLVNIFLKKAQAALKANKPADAVEAAKKVNSYAENANAYKLIASASTKLNKTDDAIAAYEKYLELNPTAKDVNAINFTIAATYQKAGNKAKAKEFYLKVPATDPQFGAQAKAIAATL